MNEKPVILFDGVCNLCNSSVDFVLKRDKNKIFVFSALQSESGRKIIADLGLKDLDIQSVALIEDKKIYYKSRAALRVLKKLPFPWNLASIFIIIPRPIRDFFYDIIAKNRYRWFGKRDECRLPNREEENRFLI